MFKKIKQMFIFDKKKMSVQSDKYTKYLSEQRFKRMGIKKLIAKDEYGVVVDKRNHHFVVILVNLIRQNGTNAKIDMENYNANVNALDNIHVCKAVLRAKHMNRLKSNIQHYQHLLDMQDDLEIKRDIEERLQYMNRLNRRGEMLCYYYILEKDLGKALAELSVLFQCDVLSYEKLQEYLFEIHNERGVIG